MSDSNATLKFGGGFEYPWLTPHGETPEEIQAWIRRADEIGLVEDIIEFSLKIRYMMNAAERIGWRPDEVEKPAEKSEGVSPEGKPAQKRNTKGGLAAQAKASRSPEPEDNTTDVAALIKNATSTDALNDIYEKHDGKNWPAELMQAAKNRAEEITA
jgi:hypothetical protein